MQARNSTSVVEPARRRPSLVLAYSRDEGHASGHFSIAEPLSADSQALSLANGLAWLVFLLVGVAFYAAVTVATLQIWG